MKNLQKTERKSKGKWKTRKNGHSHMAGIWPIKNEKVYNFSSKQYYIKLVHLNFFLSVGNWKQFSCKHNYFI